MAIKVKIKMKKKKQDSKIVAKAVLITKDDSVILLKRSKYMKKHKDEWDLPGGHVHKGEEIKDGLCREVKEETKLQLRSPLFVFKNQKDHFFVDKWDESDIHLSDEHVSFIFHDIDKIDDLELLTTYYKSAILKCYEAYKENDQF